MRTRIFSFSLISFILLFHIILTPAADAANKIMPLGDSITQGNSSGVNDEAFQVSYRKALYDRLKTAGYVVIDEIFVGSLFSGESVVDFDPDHDGHPGWQADQIVNGNMGEPLAGKLDQWLIAEEPNIVLLHIGTNDISAGNEDWNDVEAILGVIDNYESTSGKAVWVVLSLIIDRACSQDTPPCSASAQTTAFNDDVRTNVFLPRQAGGNDKIMLVDMQNDAGINYNLTGSGGDMFDDLHPFEPGYVKMADLWFSGLVDILPEADAGPDQSVNEFETVALDGTGSTDPKSGTLSYQWVQTAGTPVVVLSDDTAAKPAFDAPDAGLSGKILTFTLTVTDDDELVSTDTVDIDVQKIPPQADAGLDQNVNEFDPVTLDGSGSVGVGLSYQWTQPSGTTVILSGAATATATFTAPDVSSAGETLTFQLTVTDDDAVISTDTVSITVQNPSSSGGGGGGCFIGTAANGSPMALHGKVLHELRSQFPMVNGKRLMFGNISRLTPREKHVPMLTLVITLVGLIGSCVAIALRKPRKRWLKLYHRDRAKMSIF
jgi:hypothetical protein